MEINLINKTAWVFGASRGIGKAIAIELASAGANILLIARSSQLLNQTKKSLCTNNNQTHGVLSVDMSNPDSLLKSIKSHHNMHAADIIINNTGGPPSGMAHMAELEEYKSAFFQHVLSAQTVAQVVQPRVVHLS